VEGGGDGSAGGYGRRGERREARFEGRGHRVQDTDRGVCNAASGLRLPMVGR
jgi:hypothetical protein